MIELLKFKANLYYADKLTPWQTVVLKILNSLTFENNKTSSDYKSLIINEINSGLPAKDNNEYNNGAT